jgi:hypothetical protein
MRRRKGGGVEMLGIYLFRYRQKREREQRERERERAAWTLSVERALSLWLNRCSGARDVSYLDRVS